MLPGHSALAARALRRASIGITFRRVARSCNAAAASIGPMVVNCSFGLGGGGLHE
jgi:hypothetical protein